MGLFKATRNIFIPSFLAYQMAPKKGYDFSPILLIQKIKILNWMYSSFQDFLVIEHTQEMMLYKENPNPLWTSLSMKLLKDIQRGALCGVPWYW